MNTQDLSLHKTNEVEMIREFRDSWTMTAVVVVMGSAVLAGCASRNDPVTQAARAEAVKGIAAPSIAETKTIAEEAFIYGLPIVMNYAVMHEYAVDMRRAQFKAPFNQIKNEPRVYKFVTYLAAGAEDINGWKIGSLFEDRDYYHGDC